MTILGFDGKPLPEIPKDYLPIKDRGFTCPDCGGSGSIHQEGYTHNPITKQKVKPKKSWDEPCDSCKGSGV